MTPDLADFVAQGGSGGEWDATVAAVVAALERSFTIGERAMGETVRGTYFDTFDWRLYRAGLLLQYVPGRRGSELRLTRTEPVGARPAGTGAAGTGPASTEPTGTGPASTEPAAAAGPPTARPATAGSGGPGAALTQPVAGWNSFRPRLACDIPAGPIAGRVAKLVEPRALLPVATVTTTVTTSRLLNEDGKTVAKLITEHPVLVSGGDRQPLAPRFAITEIRGYAGQARRAALLVAETPGVAAADGTLLDDALAARGRRPADYSNKINADITAQMPGAQAAAVIMLRLLDTLEANTDGVLKDIDIEFLHDFRVAVRRGRAALKLFGDVLDGDILGGDIDSAWFAAEFKWLGDLTTPTRDLDVHLDGFDDMAARLRAGKPDDLEPLRDYLAGRRAREFRALARGLRSPRFADLTRRWRAVLTPAAAPTLAAAPAPVSETGKGKAEGSGQRQKIQAAEKITAATLGAERTLRAHAKVAKRGGAITPQSPPESLHDLRKRCKELRYALEFFAPLHEAGAYAKVVGDLKRLQECLGDFQDNEVQIAEIRQIATEMQAAGGAPAVTLLAMGELTAGLADTQAAARADFEQRFAAFAGADGPRRMRALLRGGAA